LRNRRNHLVEGYKRSLTAGTVSESTGIGECLSTNERAGDRAPHERARKAVMSSVRDQLEVILRSVGDGITAIDADGRVSFANDAAARMIGYASADEMLAAPPPDWLARHDLLREDGSPFPPGELPTRRALA
jgi:PAS domain-containing protein